MPISNEKVLQFLEAQLNKIEPDIIKPSTVYTWTRDLPKGNDLDRTVDSIVTTRIIGGSGQGTTAMGGRSWIATGANDLKGVDINMTATAVRVFTAGREAAWTQMELDRYAKYGVNLDAERVAVIADIFEQEAQAVGYLGDEEQGIKGLINQDSSVVEAITGSGLLAAESPDVAKLIKALDNAMRAAEENSGETVMPTTLLCAPADYVKLFSIKMPDDNKVSLIDYLEKQSYAAISGTGFKVHKVRELAGAGGSKKNRMILYTPDSRYLKYNVLPMWREKTYDSKLQFCAAYLWRIAELQIRKPETVLYLDNL